MRRITSGAPAGPLQEGPGRHPGPGAGGHREEEALQAQIDGWAAELGRRPAARSRYASSSTRSCSAPTRTRPEYKAVVEASRATHRAPPICCSRGRHRLALPVPLEALSVRELPQGHGLPTTRRAAAAIADLPLADVQAYSIDDSQTTEIDDALSVRGLGTGRSPLGIHIAAPGLAIQPGGDLDKLGRQRLSTVYMPGYKITMLPDEVVQIYTWTRAAPTRPCRCT